MVILSSVHIHDRAQELISIGTSVISIMYGLCSYKFNICNKNQEPNITKKIKLMLRCSVDLVSRYVLIKMHIIPKKLYYRFTLIYLICILKATYSSIHLFTVTSNFRLSVLLSIIIYSLLWKKGLLISILSISIIIVVLPISAAILNNILILKTYFSDRTIIFLPLPVEFTKASEVNKPETINKLILARIRNKTLGILLMIMVILIQVLDIKGLINLTKQDIW